MRIIYIISFFCIPFFILAQDIKENTSTISIHPKNNVNFGTYPAKEEKSQKFVITNNSKDDLEFGKVRTTCECSAAELSKTILKPGESAEIIAFIRAETISGHYSKVIYIETNRQNERFLKLILSGNSVPLVKVTPSNYMYMGILKVDNEYKYSFKINFVNEDVTLALPEINSEDYQLELNEFDGYYLLNVTIKPETAGVDYSIEFSLSITAPEGWKPITFKLTGKSVE